MEIQMRHRLAERGFALRVLHKTTSMILLTRYKAQDGW